jgi:phytol kinase
MNQDFDSIVKLGAFFLGLFGLSEVLYHHFKVQVEVSRKVSHIGTGLLTMLFPLWLQSQWSVLLLCGMFFLLLVFAKRFKLLQSINGIQRESHGSASYPVIVYFCFLVWDYMHQLDSDTIGLAWFYLPILIMAFADPAAAFVGSRWPWIRYQIGIDTKSVSGSLAFFVVSFVVAGGFLLLGLDNFALYFFICLSIALVSTIAEGLSSKGMDNFSIPASVLFVLFISRFFL